MFENIWEHMTRGPPDCYLLAIKLYKTELDKHSSHDMGSICNAVSHLHTWGFDILEWINLDSLYILVLFQVIRERLTVFDMATKATCRES